MIVNKPTVMTIAGSDPSGGAGIQGDLRTISSTGSYGMTVVTALTSQNHTRVKGFYPVPAEVVRNQIEALTEESRPDCVKTGMLVNAATVSEVIWFMERNQGLPLVIDPVIRSTSGRRLIDEEGEQLLVNDLFKRSVLVTPNTGEVELLYGKEPSSVNELKEIGLELSDQYGTSFLMKGGHLSGDPLDVLVTAGETFVFEGERIEGVNTHGSGCTCASAVASFLAQGFNLKEALYRYKIYMNKVIGNGCRLPWGEVVINHEAAETPGTKED